MDYGMTRYALAVTRKRSDGKREVMEVLSVPDAIQFVGKEHVIDLLEEQLRLLRRGVH